MSDTKKENNEEQDEETKNQSAELNTEQKPEIVDESPVLSEVEKLTNEIAESKEKYLRLYADFENFRRRTAKEKIDNILNATEGLIKDLIPVMDDFERAQKSTENTEDIVAVKEGIELIFGKFLKLLTAKGLKPMTTLEQDFDVELHECITQFAAGEDKKGKVIDEIEKGYLLNDKVIRYAKVVVGS